MKIVIAWIKKYIFHIQSPSVKWLGYDYELDYIKGVKADEDANYISSK